MFGVVGSGFRVRWTARRLRSKHMRCGVVIFRVGGHFPLKAAEGYALRLLRVTQGEKALGMCSHVPLTRPHPHPSPAPSPLFLGSRTTTKAGSTFPAVDLRPPPSRPLAKVCCCPTPTSLNSTPLGVVSHRFVCFIADGPSTIVLDLKNQASSRASAGAGPLAANPSAGRPAQHERERGGADAQGRRGVLEEGSPGRARERVPHDFLPAGLIAFFVCVQRWRVRW